MKRPPMLALALMIAVALVFTSPTSSFAGGKKKATATIKILNKSKWDIHHFYLAPSDNEEWGPDQLGKDVLKSGDYFTLTDIECDVYDIKIVDEDGDECVIEKQVLC